MTKKTYSRGESRIYRNWHLKSPAEKTSCGYEMGDWDHQMEEELNNCPEGYYEWLGDLSEEKRKYLEDKKREKEGDEHFVWFGDETPKFNKREQVIEW